MVCHDVHTLLQVQRGAGGALSTKEDSVIKYACSAAMVNMVMQHHTVMQPNM